MKRGALAALALLGASGCDGEPRALRWEVRFRDAALESAALGTQVRILRGGCGGTAVYEMELGAGGAPGVLAPGTYGFAARARDVGCRWYAAGCEPVALPRDDGAVVVVTLDAVPAPEPICDAGLCRDGRCEGTDAGLVDAGPPSDAGPPVDAGRPPVLDAPVGVRPWSGDATGSAHLPASAPQLRPVFEWTAVAGADGYEIELCRVDLPVACPPAARVTARASGTSWQPEPDFLPVERIVPPLGHRIGWRVRACAGAVCADAWSAPRYVDLGRLASDVDGDGFGDLIVGAALERSNAGTVFVHDGSLGEFPGATTIELASPNPDGGGTGELPGQFGYQTAACDVNADGFADVVVGAPGEDASGDAGAVYLFYGSPAGVDPGDPRRIVGPSIGGRFGQDVACGDVTGDGYGDVIIGAPDYDAPSASGREGLVAVHRGPAPERDGLPYFYGNPVVGTGEDFGEHVAIAGDVDRDGLLDFVVGARANSTPETEEGNVFLYTHDPSGLPALGTQFDNPEDAMRGHFGTTVAGGGDFDGDGRSDLVLGAFEQHGRGEAFEVLGADVTAMPRALGCMCSAGGGVVAAPQFGYAIHALSDLDGDGFDDAVVGMHWDDAGWADSGRAVFFPGSPGGLDRGAAFRFGPFGMVETDATLFGQAIAAGDTNGDGVLELAIGAPRTNSASSADTGMVHLFHIETDAMGVRRAVPVGFLPNPRGEGSGLYGVAVTLSGR